MHTFVMDVVAAKVEELASRLQVKWLYNGLLGMTTSSYPKVLKDQMICTVFALPRPVRNRQLLKIDMGCLHPSQNLIRYRICWYPYFFIQGQTHAQLF